MNEILLQRLKELREEKDLSQRQLLYELGLSPSTITKWKTSTPKPETLQLVADYFNVTTDYLTGRTKYRNKEHMLQSFDLNYKPDMNDTEIPHDMCIQTEEGIVLIESMSAAPTYIDPDTRQLAETIMHNDQLKRIMYCLEHMSQSKVDAIYNMIENMYE